MQLGKMLDRKRVEGVRLPYLRNINVQWDAIDTTDLLEMTFKPAELERFALEPGDVLVCEGGEPGRAAVWTQRDSHIRYQKALHRVRPRPGVDSSWLVYHLRRDAECGGLERHFTGTTIKHFTRVALRRYPVLLPSQGEQQRIVDALDSYFTRLDAAETALERVQANLKRYRASVLQAAVEGRLVPTEAELARREKRDYEPASVLLERILAERRRRWEEAELAKLEAKGERPKGEAWKARYVEPAAPEVEELPDLPQGWCWCRAEALFWDCGYGTSQKCDYRADGPAVLRIPNVVAGRIDVTDLKRSTRPDELRREKQLAAGDFLVIRTNGSQNLIGRGALVSHALEQECHFASYLIRLRLVTIASLPRWFALVWGAPVLRRQILRDAASSAGQHNVNLRNLSSYWVPLPPGEEQVRIIEEIERLESRAATLVASNVLCTTRQAHLRQSILKWAFEGRLVDQDPDDEPASVLLERIRAERERATNERRQPTKGRASARRRATTARRA